MDFSIFMEHAVTVEQLTTSRDAGGGTSNSYSTRQAGVACLLKVEGTGEEMIFGQMQLVQTVTAAMYYTGTTRGDKLTVTAGPSLVGATLHIASIKDQPGLDFLGFDEIVHITCKRIL